MERPFVINHRFQVDPSLHSLTDRQKQTDIRIERRHMMLLCLLSASPGNLLKREVLVKDIWNDYGGGDEALTQSISVLRKLLDDREKMLIETVPKKGYILHARITDVEVVNDKSDSKSSRRQPVYWLVGTMAVVILGLLLFIMLPGTTDNVYHKPDAQPVATTEVPAASQSEPENSKNSSPPVGGKDDARK